MIPFVLAPVLKEQDLMGMTTQEAYLTSSGKVHHQHLSQFVRCLVAFSVYHGDVLGVQSDQVPTVHGGGKSFLGCGRSYVETTVIRNTSVWTREHGTGLETRWDLGELDLPMRPGHAVSFLWANRTLYALHNHVTHQTRYLNLPSSIFPFRRLWFHGLFGIVKLIILGVLSSIFLPFFISLAIYPAFAIFGRLDLWTARNLDPVLNAINPYLVTLLLIFCVIKNLRARAFNRKLKDRINGALRDGVEAYLFGCEHSVS
jgi:hypothetical protein